MHAEKTILNNFCKKLAKLHIDIFGLAQDEAKWITVHPGGRGRRADGDGQRGGTPVLIDGETGQILGGMGGKHNGKTIAEVKQETKEKKKLTQKQVGAISAKAQQKAYGKGFHDGQQSSFEKTASGALTPNGFAQAVGALAAQKKNNERTSPDLQSLIDKYDKVKKLEEKQKKATEEGNHTKAYKLQSEIMNANKELMDELNASSDETKKAFHAWGKNESTKQQSLQDKTDTVLALPPTPDNYTAIHKQLSAVIDKKMEMEKNGDTLSKEYNDVEKQYKSLADHAMKLESAMITLSGTDNLLYQANNVLSMPASKENADIIGKQYYDVSMAVAKLKDSGLENTKEYKSLKDMSYKLSVHWDNAQYNHAEQAQSQTYSPAVQQVAKLYWDYDKALNDYHAGKIDKNTLDMYEKSYQSFEQRMSVADKIKWSSIGENESKAAASMFGAGAATGTQGQTAQTENQQSLSKQQSFGHKIEQFLQVSPELSPKAKNLAEKWAKMHISGNDADMDDFDKAFNKASKATKKEFSAFQDGVYGMQSTQTQTQSASSEKYSPGVKEIATAFLDYQNGIKALQKGEISQSEFIEKIKKFKAAKAKASSADKQKWDTMSDYNIKEAAGITASTHTSSKQSTQSMPVHTGGEYSTPKGELSPIPQNLTWNKNSKYLASLKGHNFLTTDNPTGVNATAKFGKQGFTQADIPTHADMQSQGFYDTKSTTPKGYFKDVPHVKNAHPDLEPLSGMIDMPDKEKQHMLDTGKVTQDYREKMHNLVPFASQFGSASGRAAAYAYTAQSNTLNRILRGTPHGDDMNYKDDAAQVTQELDKMMAVSRTSEPMTLWRGISSFPGVKNAEDFKKKFAVGATGEDKGFMSTSVDGNQSANFAKRYDGWGLCKILAPKGTSAMSMRWRNDGSPFSAFSHEDEILLSRNTKWKVVGYEKGTGYLDDFEYIPIIQIIS